MSKQRDLKSKALSRSMRLLGMASSVVGKEILHSMKAIPRRQPREGRLQTRIEQAKVIADSLSQLKGAAMKAGQLLSLDGADYFPPEAIEILGKLQSGAEPVDFDRIRDVLSEDLGRERLAMIQYIDPRPAASASIGQVHRARFADRDLALKIQYPGVRESIDADLAVLENLARGMVKLGRKKMDLQGLFEELRIVLRAEADYENERRNLDDYRRLLKGNSNYVVPASVAEISTGRVLAMSWEEGERVVDWIRKAPPLESRERVARLVLDLYCLEFFEWGFVQTDPNYGNFLVREQPFRLVVLDFGATLRYAPEFRVRYTNLLRAIGERSEALVKLRVDELGLLDERESDETKRLFFEVLDHAMEPFRPDRQPFRFNDREYARRSREIGQRFTSSLRYSPPPRQILFLHRKLSGIFSLMKRLEVELDLAPYWERMVGGDIVGS